MVNGSAFVVADDAADDGAEEEEEGADADVDGA